MQAKNHMCDTVRHISRFVNMNLFWNVTHIHALLCEYVHALQEFYKQLEQFLMGDIEDDPRFAIQDIAPARTRSSSQQSRHHC